MCSIYLLKHLSFDGESFIENLNSCLNRNTEWTRWSTAFLEDYSNSE